MNQDLRPHEIADLRASADRLKCAPGSLDVGFKIHALLDVYEDHEEENNEHEKAVEKLEMERDGIKDDKAELRRYILLIQQQTQGAVDVNTALERLAEVAELAAEALVEDTGEAPEHPPA